MCEYVRKHTFSKSQRRYLVIKRVIDFALACLGLLLTSPIMLLSMAWIKAESKGPVIFKQKRTGIYQKVFTIYKLRSMKTELFSEDGRPLTDQERATKSGLFVRRTSIDELPQLVNILKGEMSLIGPRPFLINDLDTYTEEQLIRFEVLPGITSWAAVHGRNNQTVKEKYDHEIYYVNHLSFKLDLYIFLKTILLVFSQKDIDNQIEGGRIGADIQEDI